MKLIEGFAGSTGTTEPSGSQSDRNTVAGDSTDRKWLQQADTCRTEATALPPGPARDRLVRRARQLETASHMNAWLMSPGLRSPT